MPDEDEYVFLRKVRARPDALRTTPILALRVFGRPAAELAQAVERLSARP